MSLNRALSKLGVLSRAEASEAIRAGRVAVDGRLVRDPLRRVAPDQAAITLDGRLAARAAWRTIAFHKPRGVVSTRRDPGGRPTVYDVLGEAGRGLVSIGRLDLATSGLLLLTTDTRLADWVTDPAHRVPRVYVVTVRGHVSPADLERLTIGIVSRGERLSVSSAQIRKASGRESHLTMELVEGRNREVRRLCDAIGHEVTRLKRIRVGRVELGDLAPGAWREVSRAEAARALRWRPVAGAGAAGGIDMMA